MEHSASIQFQTVIYKGIIDGMQVRKGGLGLLSSASIYSKQMSGNSWRWRSIAYWNFLPEQLRTETKFAIFKSTLKKWIIENVDTNQLLDDYDTSFTET